MNVELAVGLGIAALAGAIGVVILRARRDRPTQTGGGRVCAHMLIWSSALLILVCIAGTVWLSSTA